MKKMFLGMCAALVLALTIPALAAKPDVPADGLKMEKTKTPVVFNHSTHKSAQCGECHHPVDGKENYSKCATAGCHDVFDRKDKSVKSYYNVMHSKSKLKFDTCMSCHQLAVEKAPDKKKDLTACKGSKCHPQTQ